MIVTSDKFIQQSGSVYCSLYGIDMSEDELSYAWDDDMAVLH